MKAIEKKDADAKPTETEKQSIRQELENQKLNQSYAAWIQNLQDNAKIEDYREDYF
jgi:hypothetical protein